MTVHFANNVILHMIQLGSFTTCWQIHKCNQLFRSGDPQHS